MKPRDQQILLMSALFWMASLIGSAMAAEDPSEEPASNASPLASISRPTPTIDSIEGSITAIDFESYIPTLSLLTQNGSVSMLQLDRLSTTVWRGSQQINLMELKTGIHVKIRYSARGRKQLAKTVDIL